MDLYASVYGANSKEAVPVQLTLGDLYSRRGKHAEARAQYLVATSTCEREYGARALKTAECYRRLGHLALTMGRPVDGLAAYKKLEAALEDHYPDSHVERAAARAFIADAIRMSKLFAGSH